MTLPTPFTLPDAVDAWDAEFRWREGHHLRDLTIDDTWWRVAERAASAEGRLAPLWAHRFVDGFSRWRLLPEESLLRALGTGQLLRLPEEPGAVLNVAAFVPAQPLGERRFDRERFVATASLAVRLLDDIALALDTGRRVLRLRIGLVGLADGLRLLDLDYDSAAGRRQAVAVVQALAEGCLTGSVELAEERGRRLSPAVCRPKLETLRQRGMPDWLVERVREVGLCHESLTALDPHPALARLANGVADAVAPASRADGGSAHAAMRDALQPWIDAPIAPAA